MKTPVFPIEWLIHKNYQINKEPFKSMMDEIRQSELKRRKNAENVLTNKNFQFSVSDITDRQPYYKYECDRCKSCCYFSVILCENCKIKVCLNHKRCRCKRPDLKLMYRYF
jgi:hypothetical protein